MERATHVAVVRRGCLVAHVFACATHAVTLAVGNPALVFRPLTPLETDRPHCAACLGEIGGN